MFLQIARFFSDEEGVTAIEYGLLAALIAAAIMAAVTNLGQVVVSTFNYITAAMQAAVGAGS